MFIGCSCQSLLRLSPSSVVKSQFELIRSFSNPNCWLLFHQFCCFKSAFPLLHSMTPNSELASSPTASGLSALRWTLRKASIRRWWPLSPCWPFPQWSVSWRPWLARCNTRGWKSNWDNNGMMGIGSYHFQSWFQMVKKQSFSDDVLEFDWICARDDPEWWFRFNWWVKARGPGLGRLFPNHCCWLRENTPESGDSGWTIQETGASEKGSQLTSWDEAPLGRGVTTRIGGFWIQSKQYPIAWSFEMSSG